MESQSEGSQSDGGTREDGDNVSQKSLVLDVPVAAKLVLMEVNYTGRFVEDHGKIVQYLGLLDYLEFPVDVTLDDFLKVSTDTWEYEEGDKLYGKIASMGDVGEGLMKIQNNDDLQVLLQKRQSALAQNVRANVMLTIYVDHARDHGPPILEQEQQGAVLEYHNLEQPPNSEESEDPDWEPLPEEVQSECETNNKSASDNELSWWDEASQAAGMVEEQLGSRQQEGPAQQSPTQQGPSQQGPSQQGPSQQGPATGGPTLEIQELNLTDEELVCRSDQLVTPPLSEDENQVQSKLYATFNEELNNKKPELSIGMTFATIEDLRDAITEHSIHNNYAVKWITNTKEKVYVVCQKECGWKLYASMMAKEETLQIKTYIATHKCAAAHKTNSINCKWLVKHYTEKMKEQFLETNYIQVEIKNTFGFEVSRYTIIRAKKKIKQKIWGDHVEQYENLRSYIATVEQYNRGTTISIQVDPSLSILRPRFERLYLSFKAWKNGFLDGCRPFFGLDGCHLKGLERGQILSAIGRDANNGMFPIAIAWVEAENKSSWKWFLELLIKDIGPGPRESDRGWCIMSDRQKGLIAAVQETCPGVEHRACVRHIHSNMQVKGWKSQAIRDRLWGAASTCSRKKHLEHMEELKKIKPEAYNYLNGIEKYAWARSYFPADSKVDLIVNNLSESFNARILESRCKPIVTTMEEIRKKVMREMQFKREAIERIQGRICPRIAKKVSKIDMTMQFMRTIYAGEGLFEVDLMGKVFIVNLDSRECSCGHFQLSGLPCAHAQVAIRSERLDVEDYIHECYSKEAFRRCYAGMIYPVPTKENWIQVAGKLEAPLQRDQPGRKRTKRIRSEGEPNPTKLRRELVVRCSVCREKGHNKKTCPQAPKSTTQGGVSGAAGVPSQSQVAVSEVSQRTASQIEASAVPQAQGQANCQAQASHQVQGQAAAPQAQAQAAAPRLQAQAQAAPRQIQTRSSQVSPQRRVQTRSSQTSCSSPRGQAIPQVQRRSPRLKTLAQKPPREKLGTKRPTWR